MIPAFLQQLQKISLHPHLFLLLYIVLQRDTAGAGEFARYCARPPSTVFACAVREHEGGLTYARTPRSVFLLACPLPISFRLFRIHLFHSFHQTIFIR